MVYSGWKSICKFLEMSKRSVIELTKKGLPVKWIAGKPRLLDADYYEWVKLQPNGRGD
jgi:hypothetical protein